MVCLLAIPLRVVFGLQDFITMRHLENMAKIILATGLVVAYGYTMELFTAWYSGSPYEGYALITNRMSGPYAPLYWGLLFCNVAAPQVLWFRRMRTSVPVIFAVSLIVSVGMWL